MQGVRVRLRQLMLLLLAFGLVASTVVATAAPALADTGGYPDAGATTINASQYEWGYPCGQTGQPGCVSGWWAYLNGVQYGFLSPRGYAYRNCTDYVAWKLESLGASASVVQGRGNGGQWDQSTAGGVTVSGTPAVGDAAVIHHVYPGDPYGHVAYVEAVQGSPGSYQVKVSQYNWNQDGNYTMMTGWEAASTYSSFVQFPGVNPGGGGSGTVALVAPSAMDDPSTGRNIFDDNAGYISQWTAGSSWGDYMLGGGVDPIANWSSPSAMEDSSTGRNIFFVNASNHQIQQWSVGGSWAYYQLGGSSGGEAAASYSSPSAMEDSSTGRNIFYVGADNSVWQWSVQNGSWANYQLGDSVAPDTSPVAIEDPSTGRNVFYVGNDYQIKQWSVVNGSWGEYQLGGTSGGEPVEAGTSPTAVEDPVDGTGLNVFYTGQDGNIWQWAVGTNGWVNTDLGSDAVAPGTSPSAVEDPSTGRNIFFVAPDGQIQQYSVVGGSWAYYQLNGGSGGETANMTTSPSAMEDTVQGTGINVFYYGADGNRYQWAVGSGRWLNTEL